MKKLGIALVVVLCLSSMAFAKTEVSVSWSEYEGLTPEYAAELEAAFEEALLPVLLDIVRRAIRPRTFQAFEMFTLHGLKGAEVARLTGLTRNAVYQARKEVLKRLRDLGAKYREDGQLGERVKRALGSRPGPAVERSLTAAVAQTMQSR